MRIAKRFTVAAIIVTSLAVGYAQQPAGNEPKTLDDRSAREPEARLPRRAGRDVEPGPGGDPAKAGRLLRSLRSCGPDLAAGAAR